MLPHVITAGGTSLFWQEMAYAVNSNDMPPMGTSGTLNPDMVGVHLAPPWRSKGGKGHQSGDPCKTNVLE